MLAENEIEVLKEVCVEDMSLGTRRSAVTVPSGAAAASAVAVEFCCVKKPAMSLLLVIKFVLCSSTNNPKLSPVVGSWSKRGALLIVLVVGMYSPTVVDCSSWAPQM